jgi:poly(3-hydroxybutyrate) depolymerase
MGDRSSPLSMILMAGPIDARESPTEVNRFARGRSIDWFERNVITPVPWPYPGVMRRVYPGFLQLSGFMGMNFDRHVTAHRELFHNLIKGDGDSADKHKEFYDEFLAVMDLTAEYYLQTIETVFLEHKLPKGQMVHRNRLVDPSKIRNVALMTVEGEKDDISGIGQTKAAQTLCTNLAEGLRAHHLQPGVGHYGVFNGSRFRSEIAPKIRDFTAIHQRRKGVLARAFGRTA